MNKSLTVVLPIHNAEHSLRRSVADVLDASADLSGQIQVLIVDDGSTDDSFDIACELATRYPQVRVLRQAQQRGLGPTLQAVRRRITTDVVMVHDGVTPIRSEQLLALWRQQVAHHPAGLRSNEAATMADLRRPAQIQPAMADAHRRVMGFQMLRVNGDEAPAAPVEARTRRNGVGGIPQLPRPNFLSSLANFALGE
jgi:hypothetical protein